MGLYYLCSKNKGANQLGGYCAADLGLCLHKNSKSRFSHDIAHRIWGGLFRINEVLSFKLN